MNESRKNVCWLFGCIKEVFRNVILNFELGSCSVNVIDF